MCGGLSAALGLNSPTHHLLFSYHAGRLISYSIAGVLVGLLGFWFSEWLDALILLRYAAAIMLILMGLYLAGWLNALILSEKLGALLWRRLQPLGRRFLRPSSASEALALGMVWGWLPCGLVYSALIYASTQASWTSSALIMLVFGLGTLPSMLGAGFGGQKTLAWMNKRSVRKTAGVILLAYGTWSLFSLIQVPTH